MEPTIKHQNSPTAITDNNPVADNITDRLRRIIEQADENRNLSLNALVRLFGTQPEAIDKATNPPAPPGLVHALDALFSELEDVNREAREYLLQINQL